MQSKPVFISEEGLQKMRDELEYLNNTKRKEVADRIEHAKELGDLRENADYQDAKDEMSWVMSRVIQLQDQIARAEIVAKPDGDTVSIGCEVKVKYGEKERLLTIVGATEADPVRGRISNESPLGRELIGKKVGETAEVEAPAGRVSYLILEII